MRVTYIKPDKSLFTAYIIRNLLGEAKQLPDINNSGTYGLLTKIQNLQGTYVKHGNV
jgi:hypothetical protein